MQTSKDSKVSRRALFGIPMHIQSVIVLFVVFKMIILGNSYSKLHCLNLVSINFSRCPRDSSVSCASLIDKTKKSY